MWQRSSVIAVVILTASGMAPSARASAITFFDTHPVLFSETPFALPSFNPELGTLESVNVSLTVAAIRVRGLTGFSADPTGFPLIVTGELSMTHSLQMSLSKGPTFVTVSQRDTAGTAAPVPAFSTLPITFNLSPATGDPVVLTSPSDLQFFTQDAMVTLSAQGFFSARTIGPVASDTAIFGTPNTPVDVTATLTYTFASVPEPSSLVGLTAVPQAIKL